MNDKTFTLYWRTGSREIVHGRNAAEAMTLAGYSDGSVRALDFYAEGDDRDYVWNKATREWDRLPSIDPLTNDKTPASP